MGLTPAEALDLFNSDDLMGIGMAANEVRAQEDRSAHRHLSDRPQHQLHKFLHRILLVLRLLPPARRQRWLHFAARDNLQKIEEMVELGGTGVLLQGGLHPDLQIDYYENLLRSIERALPAGASALLLRAGNSLHRRSFRAERARHDRAPARRGTRFHSRRRRGNPGRRNSRAHLAPEVHADEWEDMHRTAHALGMRTTATMMFGCGEEFRHRVNHLERLRRIQEDTGGFTAFIPWIFAPDNTPLGKKVPEATAVDYLKTLAISRLYLDNIDHIQSSWLTPGIKVCQVGLQFGADDVGSILIEENVVYAAGVRNRTNEGELAPHHHRCGLHPASARHAVSLLRPEAATANFRSRSASQLQLTIITEGRLPLPRRAHQQSQNPDQRRHGDNRQSQCKTFAGLFHLFSAFRVQGNLQIAESFRLQV